MAPAGQGALPGRGAECVGGEKDLDEISQSLLAQGAAHGHSVSW